MKKLSEGYRYVLTFEEKHHTRYFVVLNQAELEASCLKVLSDRSKDGYWYHDPNKIQIAKPSYTPEQINELKGPAKEAAQEELKNFQRRQREKDNKVELWNQIQLALATKNGKLAYSILESRSVHEYERMSLNWAEKIESI